MDNPQPSHLEQAQSAAQEDLGTTEEAQKIAATAEALNNSLTAPVNEAYIPNLMATLKAYNYNSLTHPRITELATLILQTKKQELKEVYKPYTSKVVDSLHGISSSAAGGLEEVGKQAGVAQIKDQLDFINGISPEITHFIVGDVVDAAWNKLQQPYKPAA